MPFRTSLLTGAHIQKKKKKKKLKRSACRVDHVWIIKHWALKMYNLHKAAGSVVFFGHFCQLKWQNLHFCTCGRRRVCSYVEDVLRLIWGQDVDDDLLTVGEADVEGDFFCGNLLCILWEGHGDNTTVMALRRVFIPVGQQWNCNKNTEPGGGRFLFLETNIHAELALPSDLS